MATTATKHDALANTEFMSLRELATRFGISTTTAYEGARTDSLPIPTHRVGRRFIFSRKAFDALISAQHNATKDDGAE